MRETKFALAVGLLCLTSTALAALVDDVGDADSFGRQAKYLGAKSSPFIYIEPDCAALGDIGTIDRCVAINPVGTTVTSQTNMAVFKLPANSTRSLICFSYNLYVSYSFTNNSAARRESSISVRPTYTIESPLLNGASIIDPFTGAPANGKISSSLSSYTMARTLSPGDSEFQSQQFGRGCVGGLVNKQLLQSAGLSSFQIALFFANPITVTIGSAGNVRSTERGGYQFGFRLYGD
jgi:hypothetical protein